MKLAIAVPMKPLDRAKARLRPSLGDASRRHLAIEMLTHVLAIIQASRVAEACGVVTADPTALALAAQYHCERIFEPSPTGYNAAAARASAWAQARHCDALLILPADLPFLRTDDLQQLAQLARPHSQAVIIAPNTTHTGTNALLLRPPNIIKTAFGPNSFGHHYQAAQKAGVHPIIYESPSLAQDIDWPDDLSLLPPNNLNLQHS